MLKFEIGSKQYFVIVENEKSAKGEISFLDIPEFSEKVIVDIKIIDPSTFELRQDFGFYPQGRRNVFSKSELKGQPEFICDSLLMEIFQTDKKPTYLTE